ncbi:unnamed protein product [Trichogramma brassicae]|uniref:Integrase zinc-binding domain-containing protein n=1 Tax=Trichogramma brassicae TaxID=86971 RepID=A0A6H5IAT5_9HYME|nr:unnamed protein product [Trichogramma brassicae]
MSKDIVRWAKQCVPCQQSKVHRHNRAELGNFRHTGRPIRSCAHRHRQDASSPRISKLPHDDRSTATHVWPQAIPIGDMSAQTASSSAYELPSAKRTCKRRQRRWFSARRYAYPGSSSHDKNRTKRRRQSSFRLYGACFKQLDHCASVSACSASPVRLQGPGNERLRVSSARHHSQAARAAVYRTTQSHPPHQRAKLCRRHRDRRESGRVNVRRRATSSVTFSHPRPIGARSSRCYRSLLLGGRPKQRRERRAWLCDVESATATPLPVDLAFGEGNEKCYTSCPGSCWRWA